MSLEELIALCAEKFMTSFRLALSYRWDGAIIARMSHYLECRKVVDGLSPLTRQEEERTFALFLNLPSYAIRKLWCAINDTINTSGRLKKQRFCEKIVFNEINKRYFTIYNNNSARCAMEILYIVFLKSILFCFS